MYINARFLTQKLTGVQRYGFELLKQVNNAIGANNLMPNQPVSHSYTIPDSVNLKQTGSANTFIWEQVSLPSFLKKNNSPLLLNLCNTAPAFYKNQIVTIHDLAFLKGNWHSKAFKAYYKLLIPHIINNSRHVITVSEFSKKEIINTLNVDPAKVSVVYNAPFKLYNAPAGTDLDLTRPYILSVGSIDPRKNLTRLVKAFIKLNEPGLTLYITGAGNANFKNDELLQLIRNNQNRIVFLGYRTDEELVQLYKNALCFVFPSLYEGFGLPPVEAMMNSCPVITSNVSSLPEVCGNAAMYCDPENENDITEKMKEMILRPDLRADFVAKGRLQAQKYDWDISGQKLVNIIEQYV